MRFPTMWYVLRPACAYAQTDQSLCYTLKYSMIVKLLTSQHLEFLCLKGGCTGSSQFTLVKMSNCWKSHVAAHLLCVYGLGMVNTCFVTAPGLLYFWPMSFLLFGSNGVLLNVIFWKHLAWHSIMSATDLNRLLNVSKWAATCDFQQYGILTFVDTDEPVQPPLDRRKSKWCSISSNSKGSDQTARMRRLVWAFAYRTYHIVGNLMLRLKCLKFPTVTNRYSPFPF